MTDTHSKRHRWLRDLPIVPVLAFGAVITVVVGSGVAAASAQLQVTEHRHCTVLDKDRSIDNEGRADMLVFTSCGTFTVEDSFFIGRYNSADVFGAIEVDQTYDLTVRGYRIPPLSVFPNIETLEETPDAS